MKTIKSYLKRKRLKKALQIRKKQARMVKRSQMFIYAEEV